jgi:hypothetical protein
MPTLPDERDEHTDLPANFDDAPTATGYPEASPTGAEPAPRECIPPGPPSPPLGQTERGPCPEQYRPDLAARESRERALLKGLTSGSDLTAGLSVLSDAWEELEALSGLLSTVSDVDPLELVSLTSGIARRLGAALELLRAELATASPAGAP